MTTAPKPVAVKTYDQVRALPTGTEFAIALPAKMTWKERHGVLYRTANRPVRVKMADGTVIVGVLAETPGYFARGTKAGARVWLRVPGRKTRKPVMAEAIRHLTGFKAPTLAETYTALIYLTATNPTADQVAEAQATVAMG